MESATETIEANKTEILELKSLVAEKEAALEKNRDEKSELLQKISSLEVNPQKYWFISDYLFEIIHYFKDLTS